MKTKGRFIAILAALSLLVSMMSALPAIGAVAGTIALTGGAVTDSVRWYSTVAGSNIATVSVTDADKNISLPIPGPYDIVGRGQGTLATYAVDAARKPISSRDPVIVQELQTGFAFPGAPVAHVAGQFELDRPIVHANRLTTSADLTGASEGSPIALSLGSALVSPARVQLDVTGTGSITFKLKGTKVNPLDTQTSADTLNFETTSFTIAAADPVVYTTEVFRSINAAGVIVTAASNAAAVLVIDETRTIAISYKYEATDTITGRTTLVSSAHPTTIPLNLIETTSSSGVFEATATLTSTIGNHSTTATNTATVYVTDGALLTFSYNDQDPVATVTATARADLKAPTIALVSPTHDSSTNVGALSFVVTVTDEPSADGKASGLTTTDVDNIVVNGGASADLTPLLIGTNSFQTSFSLTIASQGLTKWWFPVKDKVGNVPVFSGTTPAPILGAGNPADPDTEPAKPFKVTIDTAAPTVDTSTVQTGGKLTTAGTPPTTTWSGDAAQRKNVTVNFSLGAGTAKLDPATLSASAWSVGGVTPTSAAMDTDGDTVVLTMAADLATDATPKVELVTAGLKDKAGNTMATLTGTAAPTSLDRLKPVVDVSVSPAITKTKVTITITSDETLNQAPTVTVATDAAFTQNTSTPTVTATGTKSWTAEFTAPSSAASKRWVKVVGTDLTGSNAETRGEGTPSTDVITFQVDTAAPSVAFKDAGGATLSSSSELQEGAVWIVAVFDEDEDYTGDTYKKVTVTAMTLKVKDGATVTSAVTDLFTSDNITYTLAINLTPATYNFSIAGTDEAGNAMAAQNTDFKVVARTPFSLTLKPGVNLVSIPGTPVGDGGNINVLLQGLPVTAVLTYDAALNKAGSNPWLSSTKDPTTGLFTGDIATIEPGKAYFITATATATAKVLLTQPSTVLPPTMQVLQGFNSVGFWAISADTTADADAYLGSIKWSVAYSFDPTPGVGWQVIRPDGNLTSGTTLVAGRGYLVYFSQDGTLTP